MDAFIRPDFEVRNNILPITTTVRTSLPVVGKRESSTRTKQVFFVCCSVYFVFVICVRGCGTVYKAVFVLITVLAGICVSLLKEAGGGLVLSQLGLDSMGI